MVTNSLYTAIVVVTLLVIGLMLVSKNLTIGRPSKGQLFLEMVYTGLRSMCQSILGEATAELFPFVLTFFVFILASNWFGLLPISGNIGFWHQGIEGEKELVPYFRAPTSDLSAALALAMVAVISINYLGFKKSGKNYGKKYLDTSNGINFAVGLLETISELGKILSFSFRLFGNVFAGEVMLVVITGITYGVATFPFLGLEVFVGLIQAFVFFMLLTVFISLAVKGHH